MFEGRVSKLEIIEDKYSVLILSSRTNIQIQPPAFEMVLQGEKYSVSMQERMVGKLEC